MSKPNRHWRYLEIKITDGFNESGPPISITCHNDGMLIFKLTGRIVAPIPLELPYDRKEEVKNKELKELDSLVEEIRQIENVEGNLIMDGPSFECYVHLNNGTVCGFHYCSIHPKENIALIEQKLREYLKEDLFRQKYGEQLGALRWSIIPE